MKRFAFALLAVLAVAAEAGAQATDGLAQRWSSYRDFWFGHDSVRLHATDSSKVSEIADYMKRNPAYRVGIDGAIDAGDPDLGGRRVGAVRNALIQAGVPAHKIDTGDFGDARLRRERRVEVLVNRE